MTTTAFDQWIWRHCQLEGPVSQQAVDSYQLAALSRQAAYVVEHSRFYRQLYAGYDLQDPLSLPLISSEDIVAAGTSIVCLSQSQIKRIVSMMTSGSTAAPKRVYFSEADLELTIDFFANGMLLMTGPGERVMICMDGQTPDGLGDLLARGLRRDGVEPLVYGYLRDMEDAAAYALAHQPHCLVGVPQQVLALAESCPQLRPRTVLLSADNVKDELRQRIEQLWQTEVFSHWGMRETGLGGAVECPAHDGHHIRHADLLVEIIDPISGRRLPDGEWGEIVISTLTREAMPLLRYRTGDISRLLAEPCRCGSPLKRLDAVEGHKI